MDRLKSLPWTQILLGLILLSSLANLVELRRVKKATDDVYSEVSDEGSLNFNELVDIKNSIDDGNDVLKQIDINTACIENHLQPGCTIQLMPPRQ